MLRVSEIINEVDEEELWTIVYPGLDGLHIISIPVAPPDTSNIIGLIADRSQTVWFTAPEDPFKTR